MPEHRIATREEWETERASLLEREKQLTRMGDELAQQRRDLPWVPIEKTYTLQTAAGPKTLAELFDGRSQLVVYHFMFGPDWDAGCPVCSSIADSFNGVLAHLEARDVTMIAISRASSEKLTAFAERMGWTFTWASSHDSDFNWEWGHSVPREQFAEWAKDAPSFIADIAAATGSDVAGYVSERPGLSVFIRSGDDIYLTYQSTARGLELVMTYYGILDRVPRGRDEHEPTFQSWLRHHDRYSAEATSRAGS